MAAWRRMILAGLIVAAGLNGAQAADTVLPATNRPLAVRAVVAPVADEVLVAPPAGVVVAPGPIVGPPMMPFGCTRVWRCDTQVCEWRRGCNGLYGYVEGPYYNKPLAQRQWERDGLPGPGVDVSGSTLRPRNRVAVDPALK